MFTCCWARCSPPRLPGWLQPCTTHTQHLHNCFTTRLTMSRHYMFVAGMHRRGSSGAAIAQGRVYWCGHVWISWQHPLDLTFQVDSWCTDLLQMSLHMCQSRTDVVQTRYNMPGVLASHVAAMAWSIFEESCNTGLVYQNSNLWLWHEVSRPEAAKSSWQPVHIEQPLVSNALHVAGRRHHYDPASQISHRVQDVVHGVSPSLMALC